MYLSTRYLKIENIHINTLDPVLRKTGKSLNDVIIEQIKMEEDTRKSSANNNLLNISKNNSYFINKYFKRKINFLIKYNKFPNFQITEIFKLKG